MYSSGTIQTNMISDQLILDGQYVVRVIAPYQASCELYIVKDITALSQVL